MFRVDNDLTIHMTRGDIGAFEVRSNDTAGEPYIFQPDDLIRFKVFVKKKPEEIVLYKDVIVSEETDVVDFRLDRFDTKIGDIISKPVDYWYEVEVNPDTTPQTIIGYDADGAKVFRLYPEGGDIANDD